MASNPFKDDDLDPAHIGQDNWDIQPYTRMAYTVPCPFDVGSDCVSPTGSGLLENRAPALRLKQSRKSRSVSRSLPVYLSCSALFFPLLTYGLNLISALILTDSFDKRQVPIYRILAGAFFGVFGCGTTAITCWLKREIDRRPRMTAVRIIIYAYYTCLAVLIIHIFEISLLLGALESQPSSFAMTRARISNGFFQLLYVLVERSTRLCGSFESSPLFPRVFRKAVSVRKCA
jgi:hypothetical protein